VKKPELQPERVTSIPKSPPDAKVVADIKTPASSEKITSHPYSLLLYHFRSLERAKNAVSLYNKKGLSAYWVKVELSNGVWYRVFVGYFEDHDQAERFRREHGLLKSTVKKTKYANLIGIYSSSDELEDKILSLKGLGYSPYTMTDRDGKSRLFVGTFITKEGAEKQYDDLESNGIKNMIVER
jgi:cell division septation protein DedD